MRTSISALIWIKRSAAKLYRPQGIRNSLRPSCNLSQHATEVVFSGTNRRFFLRELGFLGAHPRMPSALSVPRRLPAPQELSRPAREAGDFLSHA